jgi:hypothetical protein
MGTVTDAWDPQEMIEHHLKTHPDTKPVSQKPQRQSVERQDFIR